VWLCLRPAEADDRAALVAILFLLGALPWTHHKYLLYVPGLLFAIVWNRWALIKSLSRSERAAAAAIFAAPQFALLVWSWREWGALGGALTTSGLPFSAATFKTGVLGLWIDRQSGLLAYAPLYWIVPACWYLTRRTTWPFLVPASLLYLPAASFTIGWWAGFSPAARYIVPLVPFLVVALAGALRYRTIRIAALVLLVPQVLIDAVVWQHPRTLWPSPAGNATLQILGPIGRAYEAILPPLQTGGSVAQAFVASVFAALASAVVVVIARREEHRKEVTAGR
jgi:hypothetical protein